MVQDMSPGSRTAIQAAHHQIGNSLQSVASLLRLEARTAPPEAAGLLKEASRRVGVVMRLHQRLQEGEGDSVHLDDLIGDVCRDVAALDDDVDGWVGHGGVPGDDHRRAGRQRP